VGAGVLEAAVEDTLRDFDKRQREIRRKHIRLAKGYVTKLDGNGVFLHVPENKAAQKSGLRLLLLGAMVVFGFKILTLSWLGIEDYSAHLATLEQGSALEKAGAWIMQIDPLTEKVAGLAAPYLG
jgi:hypothetical protein